LSLIIHARIFVISIIAVWFCLSRISCANYFCCSSIV